jgi:hypothetical protein
MSIFHKYITAPGPCQPRPNKGKLRPRRAQISSDLYIARMEKADRPANSPKYSPEGLFFSAVFNYHDG